MIYQLPTGKIVHISLDEYLNLTDEDVQYLISTGGTGSPNNPFHGSHLSKPTGKKDPEVPEVHDHSLDYQSENEDVESSERIDINNLPEDL